MGGRTTFCQDEYFYLVLFLPSYVLYLSLELFIPFELIRHEVAQRQPWLASFYWDAVQLLCCPLLCMVSKKQCSEGRRGCAARLHA